MVRIADLVQGAGRLVGLDVYRHKPKGWHWSHTVESYYPVDPEPQWGFGKPLHAELNGLLQERRDDFRALLQSMQAAKFIMDAVHFDAPDKRLPSRKNNFFSGLDAAALIGMLHLKKPSTYLEIGSGNSTKFARLAVDMGQTGTKVISVDPQPRNEIDSICDTVIRKPFEQCSDELQSQIKAGDIVFFDGSHRVFANSDAAIFFFDFLPKLPAGVFVHIHDIFLPADYPPEWNKRLYSEQYVLAALMLNRARHFEILLPNYFVCIDPELRAIAEALMPIETSGPYCNSFWIKTI